MTPRAGRLSRQGVARLPLPLTEAQFQRQITEYAEMCGWSWAHFRPAETSKGWRTPVSGPLGAGFPDLVLVRDGRLMFMEVKRAGGQATPAQNQVMRVLAEAAEVYIVQPKDWDFIESELR